MTFDLEKLALTSKYGYTRPEIVNRVSMNEALDDVAIDAEIWEGLDREKKDKNKVQRVYDFLNKHEVLFDDTFVYPFGEHYVSDVSALLAYIEEHEGAVATAEERARQAEEKLVKSEENVKSLNALNGTIMDQLSELTEAAEQNAKGASAVASKAAAVDAEFRETQHTFSDLATALIHGGSEMESLRERLAQFLQADEERSAEFNQIASELDGTISYMLSCFEKLGKLKEFFKYDTVEELYQAVAETEA